MSPTMKAALCALAILIAAPAIAADQPALPPLPDNLKPIGFNGYALNVVSRDKERAFFEQAFGMKLAGRIETATLKEYLMNWTGVRTDRPLIIINEVPGARDPAQAKAGRIVIGVPNAAELARRVVAAGGSVQGQIRENATNFVFDPEGNLIELYQMPAARPAAAAAPAPK